MQLMLSHPSCSFFGSFARNESSMSVSTLSGAFPLYRSVRIKLTNSCPFSSYLSHIPSHPISKN